MAIRRVVFILVLLSVAALAAALVYAWHGAIAPINPPAASSFDRASIERGATLALIGDCRTCHTAPGGKTLAGGLAMPTPFGTIYSTNITPDPQTGIGLWSLEAFSRAMREGLDREGRHLYPAFPYDHFSLTTDEDLKALYAFLMSRDPVVAEAPPNELPFPINIRLVLAGWKLLFFHPEPYAPAPARDAAWNRGRYLVEGLAHCGACHTPRNLMGAEIRSEEFAGGEAEGWTAFPLGRHSAARIPWTEAALNQYLRQGWQADHGVALGPMQPVVENLADAPADDVAAMAHYLASLGAPDGISPQATAAPPDASGQRPQSAGWQAAVSAPAAGESEGRLVFAAACASCHDSHRSLPLGGVDLALSTTLAAEAPRNLLNIILLGVPASDGHVAPIMPNFAASMNDAAMTALLGYLRQDVASKPAWPELPDAIAAARRAAAPSTKAGAAR
ncbi:mono/diheme cytochrome c family protein [Angulomicrobium tetraedrale]|uniref:Mono/diheme cytochrome c family protein n=1 Tax=Ancylobacter tetraedralis TaxID=217068 RepID=A0A839ZES7_9HYPH|nr:cytochrome c [Ancylobacter tetraedralis]MBB3773323.1 mono/diheme cytochrome c family protein [Ancylobacter tetraedralis]